MLPSPNCRTVLSMLVFWGQIQNYMMRVSLSLIILAMVRDPEGSSGGGSGNGGTGGPKQQGEGCQQLSSSDVISGDNMSGRATEQEGELEWDSATKGLVLSAFSWGYVCSQVLGGRLAELYGFKLVYGAGIFFSGLLMLLHPIAARTHSMAFVAVRVIMGVALGGTWPSMHTITARWVPKEERSSFIAQTYFGSTFGLILTYPMCGFILARYDWSVCYYVIAVISFLWSLVWWFLAYNHPKDHPRICREELALLETIEVNRDKKLAVPWRQILSSPPVWGTLVTDCCNTWGIVTLATYGPTFLKTMMGVDIKTNGMLSGLPMLARYLGGVAFARLADWLIRSKRIRLLTSRKIFNSVSQMGPAVAMVVMVYTGCNVPAVILFQVVGMWMNGAMSAGHFASGVDLAPNFAGTIYGICNTVSGGAAGALAPLTVGYLTQGAASWSAWRSVFWLAALIYTLGNLLYVALVEGEAQPWNNPTLDREEAAGEADIPLASRHTAGEYSPSASSHTSGKGVSPLP